ncbi:hypothetical protein NE236_42935 [Actinoallomurus purpureus]|uniref:hypothetical protein n=1 Tax=Actinoallomurus purpureus TaxID=478114 RepID=UPI002092CD47|nr:hypothetical protein [Actinoallomurus purpureus]MCO6011723.1 hypothetical protein [Actinoallomurus purpureus]
MSVTSAILPFQIGRDYDQAHASDGESRFGAYVRDAAASNSYAWDLQDAADQRHEFAHLAWMAATPPVMAPGYVRYHHLIKGAHVYRSQWDGSLLASVTLATPPPAALARLRGWQGWPRELSGSEYVPVEPYEEQIGRAASGGYLLTTTEMAFPLAASLPDIPDAPDAPDLAHTAAVAVGALVGALNDVVSPVLDAL